MKYMEPGQGLSTLCLLFGKTRQAYYWHLHRRDTRMMEEAIILLLVQEVRAELHASGVRQIKPILDAHLKEHGIQIGRDRLYDLLSIHGLLQPKKRKQRRVLTTDSNHQYRVYPNLLEDLKIDAPEQVFASDITYIRLYHGFAYLSLVTDVYSRKIMGYCLHPNLETEGPISALQMALTSRLRPIESLIHHSDRGVQYCSKEYISILKRNDVSISMTRKRSPHENAIAERVNGILKHELGLKDSFRNIEEAQQAVRDAIEKYNQLRPHSSCNYKTPAEMHEK